MGQPLFLRFGILTPVSDHVPNTIIDRLVAKLGDSSREAVTRLFSVLSSSFVQESSPDSLLAYARAAVDVPDRIPCLVEVVENDDRHVTVTIVAPDYPAEFAAITGLLSASGLDIQSGQVHTTAGPAPGKLSYRDVRRMRALKKSTGERRSLIIDRFTGIVSTGEDIAVWAGKLKERLATITGVYLKERPRGEGTAEVKRMVAEEVSEALTRGEDSGAALLMPVEIEIASAGEGKTAVTVGAEDTPFFLYAVSTALWLSGVTIDSVEITTLGDRLEDRFVVTGIDPADADAAAAVRLSVAFTKQFTSFLPAAPDPYQALVRFEQLLLDLLEEGGTSQADTLTNPVFMRGLAKILGTSDFLWEDFIRGQYESLFPLLDQLGSSSLEETELNAALDAALEAAGRYEEKKVALNRFKDREIYRIDLDHIVRRQSDFFFLGHRLTALAEAIINAALAVSEPPLLERHGRPVSAGGLPAVYGAFGLGKLGGAALGYASDIELLLIYSDSGRTEGPDSIANSEYFERWFREATSLIETKREGIFSIDLRLRPHGSAGPVAVALEQFVDYYSPAGPAHSFERLALVRMRGVAGDPVFCRRVERLRDDLIYTRRAIDLDSLKGLREKQLGEKASGGGFNAKFSAGGLVDLEYTVQILQIVHGEAHEGLRTPRIHEALRGLGETGAIEKDEAERLIHAYRFFRRLINALRMLRGNASDLLLPPFASIEFRHVARRAGYLSGETMTAVEKLRLDVETWSATVRVFVERQLGRRIGKDVPVAGIADVVLSPEEDPSAFAEFLRRSSLEDHKRAFFAIRSLCGDGARREAAVGVLVLAWDLIVAAPDPEACLVTWDRFVAGVGDPVEHFRGLLSQPRRLEFLVGIFSYSKFLSEVLIRNNKMLEWVTDPARVAKRRDFESMYRELSELRRVASSQGEWLRHLREFRTREILRIGTRDVCLKRPIEGIVAELSDLARAACSLALEQAASEVAGVSEREILESFALFAFGKLGGGELNYSSDIDLLGVYQPLPRLSEEENSRVFGGLMTTVRSALSTRTPDGHVFRVDLRLRPYGSAGPVAQPIEAIEAYYKNHASLWEFQALLKVGYLAGSRDLAARMTELVNSSVRQEQDVDSLFENIRRLRSAAASRTGEGVIDVKDGVGGIRDVEFLTQGLQLIYATEIPQVLSGNTFEALRNLDRYHLLPTAIVDELTRTYVYLRRIEHLLQLYDDRQTHTVPADSAGRTALARRMGETPEAFEEHLATTMRRVRELFETFLRAESAANRRIDG